MKITANRNLETASKEILDIKIEFDPSNENEEGYAALIATLIDTVKRVVVLESALIDFENNDEHN